MRRCTIVQARTKVQRTLFFYRHGHRDRLNRIVGGITGGRHDLVQDFDAAKDFPEHGVAPVESAVVTPANKELRAVVA